MARPSKLTPERRDAIVASIRQGMSPERAAQAVGISRSTFYDWMRQGRHDADNNHPDPKAYTLAQLHALAAQQDINPAPYGTRQTRAELADRVVIPTPFSEFSDACQRADAEGEAYLLARCIQAGGDSWQMWMTILERRFGWVRPEPAHEAQLPTSPIDPAEALNRGRALLKIVESKALDAPRLPPTNDHEPNSR